MRLSTLMLNYARLMGSDRVRKCLIRWRTFPLDFHSLWQLSQFNFCREIELHAMRMGPGKHLQGRTLAGGIVKPEEVHLGLCLELTATI